MSKAGTGDGVSGRQSSITGQEAGSGGEMVSFRLWTSKGDFFCHRRERLEPTRRTSLKHMSGPKKRAIIATTKAPIGSMSTMWSEQQDFPSGRPKMMNTKFNDFAGDQR